MGFAKRGFGRLCGTGFDMSDWGSLYNARVTRANWMIAAAPNSPVAIVVRVRAVLEAGTLWFRPGSLVAYATRILSIVSSLVTNRQLKQAACRWSCGPRFPLRDLAGLKTSVWLHDASPGTRRDDARRDVVGGSRESTRDTLES